MRQLALPFLSGGLFAAGLVVGGMTQPAKVVGFLNFTGAWDPSLAFVMAGAICAYAPLYRWVLNRKTPFFGGIYRLPTRSDLDGKLLGGAALFGVGWGLAGFCPGPAIASLGTAAPDTLLFVFAMLIGMLAQQLSRRKAPRPQGPAQREAG